MAAENPNVYTDISAWEPILRFTPFVFCQTLFQAKMICGLNKIVFGSDWPLFTPVMSLTEWVNGIKNLELPLPLKMMGLPEFSEKEKEYILGKNAQKILL